MNSEDSNQPGLSLCIVQMSVCLFFHVTALIRYIMNGYVCLLDYICFTDFVMFLIITFMEIINIKCWNIIQLIYRYILASEHILWLMRKHICWNWGRMSQENMLNN